MSRRFFWLILFLAATILLALGTTVVRDHSAIIKAKEFALLSVGQQQYAVEVARIRAAQEQGLSNRDSIGSDGMLFIFSTNQNATFWMKGMRFGLDIVWIYNGTVIGIDQNVSPPMGGQDPEIRQSPGSISQVLELPAGSANLISVGDLVSIDY